MISILSIALIVITLLCVLGLGLNRNIMKCRLLVEENFAVLENLLRQRLELLLMLTDALDSQEAPLSMSASKAENPRTIFENTADALAADIIKTLPQVIEAQKLLKSREKQWPAKIREALKENTAELSAAADEYNKSLIPYNESISRFPGNVLAVLLTISTEDPFLDSEKL